MSQENVEIARRWMELNNSRDLDGVLELMASGIECFPAKDQPDSRSFRGPEAFARYVRAWLDVFDEYEIEPREFIDAGEYVVVVGHIRGRAQVTGIEVSDEEAWLLRFRDGKAIEYRECRTKQKALKAAGLAE